MCESVNTKRASVGQYRREKFKTLSILIEIQLILAKKKKPEELHLNFFVVIFLEFLTKDSTCELS